MSIASRAVKDSRAVADLAVAAAKNELIEQLTPTIKAIIDGQLRASTLGEDVDRLRRAADGAGETEFEEGVDMKKSKHESVASLFPGVAEVADVQSETASDDNGYDDTTESIEEDGMDEAKEDDGMDEELEISESELEAMYAEALQLEVDVTKGFKDMAKPHEFGAGVKGQYQSDPANLADYKSGEAEWDNVVPPEKKDFTVKEIRKMVKRGMAENKALSEQNGRLTEMVKALHGKLAEMNLLNSKILHVNRFMSAHRLTAEQKKAVIESIDKGGSVKEVKSIFSILEASFQAAGAVNETVRRPRADAQKLRTSGAPNAKVLRESADKSEEGGYQNRWAQLAGLKKITG